MRTIFSIGFLILMIAGGVWWWSSRELEQVVKDGRVENVDATKKSVETNVKTNDEKVPIQSKSSLPPIPIPSPPGLQTDKQDLNTIETNEEIAEKQIANTKAEVLQWVKNSSDLLLRIGKLWAIYDGRYTLKEGENMPDLRLEFAELTVAHNDLIFSSVGDDIQKRASELISGIDGIISGLPEELTVEDLVDANKKRRQMEPLITELYKLLE